MTSYYWLNFFKQKHDPHQITCDLWADTPLFKHIAKRAIFELVPKMHYRQYKKDEVIFHEGDLGSGAIMILEGAVKITSNEMHLADLVSGDFFGEIALAQTDKRTASAVAQVDSSLVFLLKQDVEEWLNVDPKQASQFLKNLAEVIALRLQKINESLSAKSA